MGELADAKHPEFRGRKDARVQVLTRMRPQQGAGTWGLIRFGELSGHEGIKLEEMIRSTDSGCELIGRFPFEEELLA